MVGYTSARWRPREGWGLQVPRTDVGSRRRRRPGGSGTTTKSPCSLGSRRTSSTKPERGTFRGRAFLPGKRIVCSARARWQHVHSMLCQQGDNKVIACQSCHAIVKQDPFLHHNGNIYNWKANINNGRRSWQLTWRTKQALLFIIREGRIWKASKDMESTSIDLDTMSHHQATRACQARVLVNIRKE